MSDRCSAEPQWLWRPSIRNARREIAERIGGACAITLRNTWRRPAGTPMRMRPTRPACPWTLEQCLDEGFWLEGREPVP
jgi:hypothetical protein